MCYTNYGARVDAYAWGENVVTLSYLRANETPLFSAGPDRLYVPNFGGTSSAGAIVAGAVASLQGHVQAVLGYPFPPGIVRLAMTGSGTAQSGDFSRPIGTMPNLAALDFQK